MMSNTKLYMWSIFLLSFFKARNQLNYSGVIDEKEGTCSNESEVQTNKVDELRMLESGFVSTLFLTFAGSSSILIGVYYKKGEKSAMLNVLSD